MKLKDLLERLQEFDLLLDTDPKFPSISGLVAGSSVRGSWWAHPQAHEMFGLACELRSHPDVLMVKLISGKVTLIYRPLWPAVFAVGTAREAWQMKALSKEAKELLKKVDKEDQVNVSAIQFGNSKPNCWFIRKASTRIAVLTPSRSKVGSPGRMPRSSAMSI